MNWDLVSKIWIILMWCAAIAFVAYRDGSLDWQWFAIGVFFGGAVQRVLFNK